MAENFQKVRDYILDLGYDISHSNEEDNVLVVNDPSSGLNNLVIGVADPLVIFEQFIFECKTENALIFKSLLQKNRDIIHGAFVLDEEGDKVIFRDTLQVENLDINEIEATINSLSLLLSEYSDDLIRFSHLN
jgi:hypothetical protein